MSFELADLSENNREFDEDEHDNILRKADKILESEKLLNNGNNNSSGDDEIKENDERAQIFNLKSIAIPIFYFIRFSITFSIIAFKIVFKKYYRQPQATSRCICSCWETVNLKVFIGFFPILWQRTKPYMFFGTILY